MWVFLFLIIGGVFILIMLEKTTQEVELLRKWERTLPIINSDNRTIEDVEYSLELLEGIKSVNGIEWYEEQKNLLKGKRDTLLSLEKDKEDYLKYIKEYGYECVIDKGMVLGVNGKMFDFPHDIYVKKKMIGNNSFIAYYVVVDFNYILLDYLPNSKVELSYGYDLD